MPNILDKLLNLMGVEDEDDDDDFSEPGDGYYSREPLDGYARKKRPEVKTSKGRLISFPSSTKNDSGEEGINKIVLCELSDLDQIPEVVSDLKGEVPVVVNLRRTESKLAQRLLDLLCGVVFALDGKIAKVEESIYLLTPKGVNISADVDLLSLDPELDWLNR